METLNENTERQDKRAVSLSNRRLALKEKPNMRKVSAKQFICMLIGFDSILLVINCVKSKNKIHKAPSAPVRKTRVFICYVLL